MNPSQKIDYQEFFLNGGSIVEFDSEFSNGPSSQFINMDPQGFGPAKNSGTILEKFESAFNATDQHYMGFPQYDFQVGNYPSACNSRTNDSQFSYSFQSPGENFSIEPEEPNVITELCSNQFYRSAEKPDRFSGDSVPGRFPGDNVLLHGRHFPIARDEKQDQNRISYDSYSSPHVNTSFSYNQEKLFPKIFLGNSISAVPTQSSKTRIRWTQDLHEKFVDCVNRLGGAEKATPKAILKLMDSYGLTIFHVKSHLQKYRIAKYMPDFTEGKSDRRGAVTNDVPNIDPKTCSQIKEALQVQLDVQKCLHEQLEIQRNLQLRIEEQGKQLKMMFDQQQKNTSSLFLRSQNLLEATNPTPFGIENLAAEECSNNINTLYPSKIS